jgi:D-alanyl-D-alanine carboxypeptidase (penicillin-binding protein 5/6)
MSAPHPPLHNHLPQRALGRWGKALALATLTLSTLTLGAPQTTAAQGFETAAQAAWVYDVATHTVLMDKNGNIPLPPASMSKLMTIFMLFEALQDGRITMDTEFAVSERAVELTARGGSTMYLQLGDRPTVRDLIYGMIVNSGNDACVVVAEGLAGSEAAFAAKMTERGRAIGLEHSNFVNASGWPDPRHRMSMKDLGILSLRLIEDFPEYYPIFAETSYNYQGRAPANANNRNPLLKLGIGADGLKTGHTQEAGYGLAASLVQGPRRIIFAFSGTESESARASEAERIASWAQRNFALKTVAKGGVILAQAPVFMGRSETVGLTLADDLTTLVPALDRDGLKGEITFNSPLPAPIAAGDEVGTLTLRAAGLPDRTLPLIAAQDVAKSGLLGRMYAAAGHIYARLFGPDQPALADLAAN